jgi:glycosyltransferase involved in cell wall biosynthesis
VIVVLPAYNEAAVIEQVVREVRARWPCIVVDDGSTDDTAAIALNAGATVARHIVNRGQGAALRTGMELGLRLGAQCIVTFDSDGQHRPEDIERLIEPIASGRADVALGTRFPQAAHHIPAVRRFLLRLAVWATRLVSRVPVSDAHNGLRALSRGAAERIELEADRMAHASELIDQIRQRDLKFVEVPVDVLYTEYSRLKGQRASSAVRIVADYLVGRIFR